MIIIELRVIIIKLLRIIYSSLYIVHFSQTTTALDVERNKARGLLAVVRHIKKAHCTPLYLACKNLDDSGLVIIPYMVVIRRFSTCNKVIIPYMV